ncbi:aminoglycoside phosphotransferase family protein [Fodinicola acaciae]|uniref:aminoglycoside phosphotransferase family protein n=1 Tax=Fodinicola acaciae TaxID=2681555 RepID=UPI001FEC4B44|nr:aminoglycoside phosphotransferase family protein [Fodinicola acaciae]
MPAAEVDIDENLVAKLIEAQCPELSDPLRLTANGWDNAIYRLGDDLCVRLPRRQVAVQLVVNEQRWLPEFASRIRTPIPVPVHSGRPTAGYPWPWSVLPWRAGTVASELPAAERASAAAGLAAFMTELHVPAPPDAPPNPARGVPLANRAVDVEERLASGKIAGSERLRTLWRQLLATPRWDGPPLWLHGDPHPANLLLSNGKLAAVLDFGDLTGGDPATDLAAGWMVFDAPARKVFRAAVEVDTDTWLRAKAWAIVIGTAVAVHSDDSPRMAAIGRHVLEQVLLDD